MAFDSRRDLGLQRGLVSGALPEHFTTSYPKLVSFLDTYYEFMRTDEDHGFDTSIANLIKSRDTLGNDLIALENAMSDLTNGQDYSSVISDPRLKSQLLANYYRSKGSLYSIELFFRWLYGQDVTVEYGKKSVFIVGESEIGPQSLKYIKNDELYQTFALLIKVGIPVSKWRDNYKRFAHPAGFYYQGEVVIESTIDLDYRAMPIVVKDSNAGVLSVENTAASVTIKPFTSITGLYPDSLDADGDDERISFDRTIGSLSASTIAEMDNVYNSIEDVIDANSPTFDEFDDGVIKAVRFSSTIETFDQDHFDMGQAGRYVSALADSDVTIPRFDNLSFTMDNGRITMDNVE
jgi:hypothetical protein